MNWADFGLGTWHPKNGMYSIVEGMVSIAESLGVKFHTDAIVEKIQVDDQGKAQGIEVNGEFISCRCSSFRSRLPSYRNPFGSKLSCLQ